MATNPYFTQYHTQRFSFIGSPQQRDGTPNKDQRFINVYPELIKSPVSDGKKYYLKSRPGFEIASGLSGPSGVGRGIFYWGGLFFWCVGNTLYRNSSGLIALSTSSGPVGFTEFRFNNVDLLFFCDGVNGYYIGAGPSGPATHITDPNFPTPHIPTPVFIDGYIFLAGSASQRIYNSNLGDVTTWPTDGFIDAEMYPDLLQGLAKVQNYLACIGTNSIEWLYDNANSTGSPLQRNAPAVSQFGTPAPMTINQTEKELILVGQTGNGGRTVWVIDGFQPTEIANAPVREALDLEGTNIVNASASTVQVSGHKFYVLTLPTASRTFVYDFEEQMWHEWADASNNVAIPWQFATDTAGGMPIFLHNSSGQLAYLTPLATTDPDGNILCTVITTKIDFDTEKRKRFYRLSLIGDAPNGDNTVGLSIQWSDDDYNTWTSGVELLLNATYPTITQMGYSRRRAFKFLYNQPYPLRLEAFEVDIIQEVRR